MHFEDKRIVWSTQWLVFCILSLVVPSLPHSLPGIFHLEKPLGIGNVPSSRDALFALHRSLVEIDSVSGNEHAVGLYLESYLKVRNFTVERQLVDRLDKRETSSKQKQRFNILAYQGQYRQTPILLTSHIDTVPPYIPYSVKPHDEIWGRGTVDAKACIATQIQAYHELLADGELLAGQVSFLFVVGEEVGGDGMLRVNDLDMTWHTVIFGEPTELKLASGHKGILIFTITARGKSGHSGYPESGENANMMLIPALAALQRIKLPSSEKYGPSTVNIGDMHGGVAANVIAETAKAAVGIRLAAGSAETAKQAVLDTIHEVDRRLKVEFHGGGYGPVDIDYDIKNFETMTVNYGTGRSDRRD